MSEGPPDLGSLLAHAQQMQQQMVAAQEELARTEVTGSSGGGLVTARLSGEGELLGVSIDPRVIEHGSPSEAAETIADLVLAAVRNAATEAEAVRARALGPITDGLGGLGMGGPGMGGPGLPGLPGS